MDKDITAVAGDLVVPVDGSHSAQQAIGGLAEAGCSAVGRRSQRGMVSAEWAVGIVAAVAIAGVLLAVITSGQVQDALMEFILWVIEQFVSVVR